MSQVTLFSGPERRRRWSEDERLQILNEAFAPGSCVAEVSRRYDVSTSLIYIWRRKFRAALPGPVFAEAMVADDLQPPSSAPESMRRRLLRNRCQCGMSCMMVLLCG